MDQNERLHRDWIGMAQPEGLVVTPAALKAAEANVTSPVVELQAQLRELAGDGKTVRDLRALLRDVLEWSDEFVATEPESLRVGLDGGEVLAPTLALRSADDPSAFVLLVLQVATGLDTATDDKRWTATAHQRFERLLRDTGVHVGLLTNGSVFRLVYAPKGESAGWVSFRVDDMLQVAGRDLLGAFHMLLNERRLLSLEEGKRLTGLLKASREYQNTVSNRLREQILSALRELLGGLQQADRMAGGSILRDYGEHRQEIYSGLVTVLMRMVFVLFAEERGLLPIENELYAGAYSLSRLHAQLGEDRARHGDTLNDRFGAWARIVSLFRLLHDGAVAANGLRIPARRGDFFNPDKHPFLEGRPRGAVRQLEEVLEVPRISDGVIFRVLDQLLVLEGERLQYKGLDVEQIGSVYEGLMGFEIEEAKGPSIALGSDSAPVVVNLERLLALPGAERIKFLKSDAGVDVKDKAAGEVRAAKSIEELQAALSRRMSKHGGLIAAESLYLQPGEERRKSGSHYTPRSLTAPIVETTLRPVLERLGPEVAPAQLLDLKICDPAMGSAAFLVEACRQLADHLVAAWRRTGTMPELPPDEDPVLHARRLIAQRCLYGVDKNPLAVDLARLSLWLVTFAKEHPFTFVDHALRCGDSLVGLSREQIASLSLDVGKGAQVETVRAVVEPAVRRAVELRRQIHEIGDPPDTARLVELWRETNEALETVRMLGDLVVAAFFSGDSEKARHAAHDRIGTKARLWLATGESSRSLRAEIREGSGLPAPFHWELEFPEVLLRAAPGFDCIFGNPPFLGGTKTTSVLGPQYRDWLATLHPEGSSNADLAAHFFRKAFAIVREHGALGLLATNTIAQGDTRKLGLSHICTHGGHIFNAVRRLKWPGLAAVVVSAVHIVRAAAQPPAVLDGRSVDRITSYLFHSGGHDDPSALRANAGKSFRGSDVFGVGFLFDDQTDGASSSAEMHRLVALDARNAERIRSYLSGEDLNTSPNAQPSRHIIDFGELSESEARSWPDLFAIVENLVKPARARVAQRDRRELWWLYATRAPGYRQFAESHSRCLAIAMVSRVCAFTFIENAPTISNKVVAFAFDTGAALCVLQSRVHETWARFMGSTMKDDLQYTPSTCFDTFPFPPAFEVSDRLEAIGTSYYERRALTMMLNSEGLTKTYNRFHDRSERSADLQALRDLHVEMDLAVLAAYGWMDIRPIYDFREQLDESIRLTWDDDTRDEVLARLLELNRLRSEEELKAQPMPARRRPKKNGAGTATLPGIDE